MTTVDADGSPLDAVAGPQGILRHLGLRIAPQGEHPPWAEIDVRPDLRNVAGALQGGVAATLVDVAAGVAVARAAETGDVRTADLNLRYLAPGRVGPVRATAEVLRLGRSTAVVEVRVVDRGAQDALVATAVLGFAVTTRG